MSTKFTPATLMLSDGTVFAGEAYGAIGEIFGEAIFDTGMGAYQEMLTDPGHHGHIVVATAPHTGNTGWNDEDAQNPAGRVWAAGYAVRDPSPRPSNWRSLRCLDDVLADQGVVGIKGIDTRALTIHLRRHGIMVAGISSLQTTPADLLARVVASPRPADLVGDVTTPAPYTLKAVGPQRFSVVAIDYGLTLGVVNELAARGMTVKVLPAGATLDDVTAAGPDGVLIAGGPGDPADVDTTLTNGLLDAGLPVFGIGLGAAVLARALGLNTLKLSAGHHGVNQPVRRFADGKIAITAHNHDYTIDAPPAGSSVEVTHVGVNDGTIEGIALVRDGTTAAFGVLFNPAFGPHDTETLFDEFATMMQTGRKHA